MIPSRVQGARKGENPTVICKMPSGWAVLCDWQFLPGYAILLADPVVSDLNALSLEECHVFLRDMRLIGDALLDVTDAYRLNYQILGNRDPFLHAHICPRYEWEEPEMRCGPTTLYGKTKGPAFDLERDRGLMEKIRSAIESRLGAVP